METNSAAARHHNIQRLDTIESMKVRNTEGENLGTIDELIFDRETGEIRYAVLSFGGFLGLADKLFAVPWSAFHISTGDNTLVLNVPKDVLKEAPGFERDHWPNMADIEWGTRVHQHYGVRPYWEF